jgi:hypothetical protein
MSMDKLRIQGGDSKNSFCGELEQVFGHFPKYEKKILLGDTKLKINKSRHFKADS